MAGKLPDTATDEEKAEHSKLVKRLGRFNSPADAAKALREQDKLISSGQLKRALPKDAKPEAVAEWRKENGIPEAADKYDLGVPKGVELTEHDNTMLAGFAEKAFASNMTPEQVKAATGAYFEVREAIAESVAAANAAAKDETTEVLRAEWGSDYKTNVDGVSSLLKSSPSSAVNGLLQARTPDGVQLLNNPEVMRWLAGHARELGYVGATVVPSGGDIGKSIDDEIKAIEDTMIDANGVKQDAYWKNPKAQERYSQLLSARDRRSK